MRWPRPDLPRQGPRSTEEPKSSDHADDQARLLNDLAHVLEGVDQEPEDEARHHREDGLLQELWQWGGAEDEFGQIHQRHQKQSRDDAGAEAANHNSPHAHGPKEGDSPGPSIPLP